MEIVALFIVASVVYMIATDIELMKKGEEALTKVDIYKSILWTHWSLVGILIVFWALLDIPYEQLLFVEQEKGLLPMFSNHQLLIGVCCSLALSITLLAYLLKKKSNAALEKIQCILPQTIQERLVFFAVALTVAICEEVIFRGAASYVLLNVGVELSIWLIGVVSAIIFGLAHWYQGITGIAIASFLGFVLFVLYIQTGSLLLPIVVHFMSNVKYMWMTSGQKQKQLNVE